MIFAFYFSAATVMEITLYYVKIDVIKNIKNKYNVFRMSTHTLFIYFILIMFSMWVYALWSGGGLMCRNAKMKYYLYAFIFKYIIF